MRLFILQEDKTVALDKEWIALIPEFKEVLIRDKGSEGDYRGDKKLMARRYFTFIYFFTDFASPIRDWLEEEREKEALYYSGLDKDKIPDYVWTCQQKYHEMQLKASRPLRTLKSLYKGMDAMDKYFENIQFDAKDKQGKLLNDPSAFVTNAGKMKKMYDEIRSFEKMVEDDLKQVSGIRGPNSTLGDQEGQQREWSEMEILNGSDHISQGAINSKSSFSDILSMTRTMAEAERREADAEADALRKVSKGKMVQLGGDGDLEEEDG
jgi:hypothetical protein